jgi:Ni,Fe-hydrogenase III component G
LVETKREQEIVDELKEKFGQEIIESSVQRPRRIFVTIDSNSLIKVTEYLAHEKGFTHVSTISGLDLGKELGVIYHLIEEKPIAITLSLRANVPKENPKLSTLVKVIPGSELYEREVHELYGVRFTGHPDLSHLILPDKWPSGVYPLRKEWKIEDLKAKINRIRK